MSTWHVSDRWRELHREEHSSIAIVTEALGINGGVLLAVRRFKAAFDDSLQCWIFNRSEMLHETVIFLPGGVAAGGLPVRAAPEDRHAMNPSSPYRPPPTAPLTEPKLLATVPPMDWISAQWIGEGPVLLLQPTPSFAYFKPCVLWVEPVAGVKVFSFRVQGAPWSSNGPIPAEVFKLAMIDVSDMPIVTTLALSSPAEIELVGPMCTVLLGGVNLTQSEYIDVQQRRAQAREHGRRSW